MAEGEKTFINQTAKKINVTLFIRGGDDPKDAGGTKSVSIGVQGSITAVYEGQPGSEGEVYLNGLLIEWQEGPTWVGVSKKVINRGDSWDETLNTNDTINLSAVASGIFNASGSNQN